MGRLEMNEGQHRARTRRHQHDEEALRLDRADPGIVRAKQPQEAVVLRLPVRSTSEGVHDVVSPLASARTVRPRTRTIGRAAIAQMRELSLMAAVVAKAPLVRIVRQDLRTAEALVPVDESVASARPVVLVHGLGGTKSGWSALTRALKARGVTVHAMSYSPVGVTVEQLAERLEATVVRLRSETGADKVHLVGHSLGGVVIAQAFADGRLGGQIDTVVTIAAPFGGSPWASLLPLGATIRALRGGSPLLRRLAVAPAPEGVRWLAITATLDIIVPGRRAVPPQPGAQIVSIDDVGHLGLLLSTQVVSRIVAALPAAEMAAAA
jgi:triacylglycerol lipase